jgi:hypothetical protein
LKTSNNDKILGKPRVTRNAKIIHFLYNFDDDDDKYIIIQQLTEFLVFMICIVQRKITSIIVQIEFSQNSNKKITVFGIYGVGALQMHSSKRGNISNCEN